jgi:hypothetical protein
MREWADARARARAHRVARLGRPLAQEAVGGSDVLRHGARGSRSCLRKRRRLEGEPGSAHRAGDERVKRI